MKRTKVDLDAVKRIQADAEQGFTVYWKPAVGTNVIRILPPWSKAAIPFKGVLRHEVRVKGKFSPFTCGKNIEDNGKTGRCLVCDSVVPAFRDRAEEGDDEAQDQLNELKRKKKYMFNILDRTNSATEAKGAQVWMTGPEKWNEVLNFLADEDITDEDTGTDLILIRQGQGFEGTSYKPLKLAKQSNPCSYDNIELHDLDALCTVPEDAEVKRILREGYDIAFESEGDEEPAGEEAQADPEGDAPFDDDKGAATPDPDAGEEPAQQEAATWGTGEEDDEGRVSVILAGGLGGPKRRLALQEAQEESACYGKLHSRESEVCSECALRVECSLHTPGKKPQPKKVEPVQAQTRKLTPVVTKPTARPMTITKPAAKRR